MEVHATHQIAWVARRGTSLLSFGIFLDMIGIKIVDCFSITKSTVLFLSMISPKGGQRLACRSGQQRLHQRPLFSAPFGSSGPGGLPVPYLVIANKIDIASKDGRQSSANLVDAARMWVQKQGLLPSSEELPLTDSFPNNSNLLANSSTLGRLLKKQDMTKKPS
ncbi:hypothetical protein HPP92_021414 [Vanilla planifolia]|uniref:Uncharacterized protein n=1 Tax=Vanilla planifolia TaxID=51239 RepID=A0A835UIR5_VANPL|nr:hypothetical protein HPP92_021414 [Vanilla planifolia]